MYCYFWIRHILCFIPWYEYFRYFWPVIVFAIAVLSPPISFYFLKVRSTAVYDLRINSVLGFLTAVLNISISTYTHWCRSKVSGKPFGLGISAMLWGTLKTPLMIVIMGFMQGFSLR